MADKRDYYQVLGVDKSSSPADLKKAYRNLAKKYHPDVNPGDASAEAAFKEVNEAYEVLSDSEKRSRYDQFGHAGVDPSYGSGGGGFGFGDIDLGDLFGSFFGGGFSGGGRARNPNAPIKGTDIRTQIVLTFEEAALGCKKEINITRQESCKVCDGTGAAEGTTPDICPDCSGSGQIKVSQMTPFGAIQSSRPCNRCSGTGKIIKTPCPECGGGGRIRKTKKLEVNVPAGIDDGQTFQLRGQGDQGKNGGPYGDCNVTVSVKPHALFERDGFDVWCEMPVTYAQAVLGDELTVPTLEGKVKYNVSEGTQPGTVFRLRNRGISYINGRGKGDQYVRLVVEVPKNLNSRQKEALREFEKSLGEKNYAKRDGFFKKLKDMVWPDSKS